MGNASKDGYKDIYKACKATLVDKCMPVRWAAAKVLVIAALFNNGGSRDCISY